MATIFSEPRTAECDIVDWQKLVSKTTFEAGGFLNVGLSSDAQKVKAGSRFELGGSLYYTEVDETISGWSSIPSGTDCYVYAASSGASATFSFSATAPTYTPAKGGWYNGNSRALAKFFYVDGNYNGKVIMDRYDYGINTVQPVPTTGGYAVLDTTDSGEITLKPGVYRYELKGGTGGTGGTGGEGGDGSSWLVGNSVGSAGTPGIAGIVVSRVFIARTSGTLSYVVGRDGGDGGDGGDGASYNGVGAGGGGGGGGGGASGQTSSFVFIDVFAESQGGKGGKGGDGGRGAGSGTDNPNNMGYGSKGGSGGGANYSMDGEKGDDGEKANTAHGQPGEGGAGGTGVKSTTSGYLKVWRVM